MIVVVDTSVWIDFFGGRNTSQVAVLKEYLQNDTTDVALMDIILCEILQGIKEPKQEKKVRQNLLSLSVFSIGGIDISIAAAANYRKLRAKGVTVRSTIDCLIATFVIKSGYTLLHSDRDYLPFEKHLGLITVGEVLSTNY